MNASEIRTVSSLERIVVRSAAGKVYDLGNPNSRLFKLRVWVYRARRFMEMRKCK